MAKVLRCFLLMVLLVVAFDIMQISVFAADSVNNEAAAAGNLEVKTGASIGTRGSESENVTIEPDKMLENQKKTSKLLAKEGLNLKTFTKIISQAAIQRSAENLAVYAEDQTDAGLRIFKSGSYDADTKTVSYDLNISAYGGTATDVTVSDCPDFDTAFQENTVTVEKLSIDMSNWLYNRENLTDYKITKSGSAENQDLTYHFSNLPDLKSGEVEETLTIRYKVKVREDLSYYETGENFIIGNTATASAKASGQEISSTTGCNVRVEQTSGYKVAKETTDIINGKSTPVLKWEAYVEKAKAGRQDMKFTDTLISNEEDASVQDMAYDKNRSILVTAYRENGTTRQMYYRWGSRQVTSDGKSFSLQLPKDDRYQKYKVEYFTTFTTDEYDEGRYVNQMELDCRKNKNEEYENQVVTSGMYTKKQPPINAEASVKYNNNALDYHLNITVPGEIGQYADNFWVNCDLTAQKDGELVSLPADQIQWKTVKATLTNGQVVEFQPYEEGKSEENTYRVVPGIGNEHAFMLIFNTKAEDRDGSVWNIKYGSQLEADYSLPLTDEVSVYLKDGYSIYNNIDAMAPFSMNWSQTEAIYSDKIKESDNLSEFLTAFRIYDKDGSLLIGKDGLGKEHNETLFAGEKYNFEFAFAESQEKGESKQMKYGEDGYLTYKVPTNLSVPTGKQHKQEIYLKNGKKVGEFYFEDPYTCKVRFDDVDENGDKSDKNFIDGHINFKVNFEGSFGNAEDGKIDLSLGDDATITVKVENNTELNVDKKATKYDHVNRTISYVVDVTAKNGPVHDITLTDSMDADNRVTLLQDSVEVIHKKTDGSQVEVNGVTVRQPDAEEDPYTYLLEGLPDLEEGESLQITYKGQIAADNDKFNVAHDKIKVQNSVQADGKNSGGLPISEDDSATAECTVTNLYKTGSVYDKLTDKDGNKVNNIFRWNVTVGDGRENVGGVTLEDELGAGLAIYKDAPIEVKWTAVDGSTGTSKIAWTDDAVKTSDKGFAVTLPKDKDYRKFELTYYTRFDAAANGGSTSFTNIARTTINGHTYVDQTTKTGEPTAVIAAEKKGTYRQGENGVNYIDYIITVDVPAGLAGTSPFWIDDWLYRDKYPISNDVQNVEVYTTNDGGNRTDFSEYKAGASADHTYAMLVPADNNSRREWFFNGQSVGSSRWIDDQHATLTVKYSVPTTAKSTDGSKTMQDFLDAGDMIVNDAYVHQGKTQEVRVQAKVKANALLKKTGKDLGDGIVEYTVLLNNYDPDLKNDPKIDSKNIEDLVFEDEFDSRMEYVDGSLKCQVLRSYDNNSVKYECEYTGAKITGNKITAAAGDFQDKSTESNYSMVHQIQHWSNAYKANYRFTYRLKLKDSEKAQVDVSKLSVKNSAHLKWDDTDGARADATVDVKTGVLSKSIKGGLKEGNILQYELDLNPSAVDLNPGADTLEARDKLPNNLSIIWDKGSQKNVIAKYEKNGEWIDFDSKDSEYQWKKSFYYDSDLGKTVLQFEVPDELHVKISYKCQVTEYGENIEISNTAEVVGKAQIEDVNISEFSVHKLTGVAESENYSFFIAKSDSVTHDAMSGVTFDLYGTVDPGENVPEGAVKSFSSGGNTYYYYSSAVTDSSGIAHIQGTDKGKLLPKGSGTGNGMYVLRERTAPAGYTKMDDIYFQFTAQPESDGDDNELHMTIYDEQFVSVVNVPQPVTAKIEAQKTLDGKAPSGSQYSFSLYDSENKLIETVQNKDGEIAFKDLNFSREGTWDYTIKESAGYDENITYDTSVYHARVRVERNLQSGLLETKVMYKDSEGKKLDAVPVFKNATKQKPTEPAGPTKPTEPTKPDEPTTPTEPSNPEQPTKPSAPSAPTEPTKPSAPADQPTTPSTSVTPSDTPSSAATPSTDNAGSSQTENSVNKTKTGDDFHPGWMILVAAAALAGAVVVARKRKS